MTKRIRKSFFQEPSKAQILKARKLHYEDSNLVEIIDKLENGESLVIERRLIPNEFRNSRQFMKHGHYLQLYKREQIPRVIKRITERQLRPMDLRSASFERAKEDFYAGFVFYPLIETDDKRERRVPLNEILEASRIVAYVHQEPMTSIDIRAYDKLAKRVSKEGTNVKFNVPSRTKNQRKYMLRLVHVPMGVKNLDPDLMRLIPYSIVSRGFSSAEDLWDFGYEYYDTEKEGSEYFTFFAHEIAAYIDFLEHRLSKGDLTPITYLPFGMPSKEYKDFYKKLLDRVLIRDENLKNKDKLTKLRVAEKEILLCAKLLHSKPKVHFKTLYSSKKRDGILPEYDWTLTDPRDGKVMEQHLRYLPKNS